MARIRWLDGIINSMAMSLSKFWEFLMDREVWHAAVHGVAKSRTRLSDQTEVYNSLLNLPVLHSPYISDPRSYTICSYINQVILSHAVSLQENYYQPREDMQSGNTAWYQQWQKEGPGGASVKNTPAKAGDAREAGWISESRRSPGEGHGNPLQYSYLENSQTEEPGRVV